MSCAGPCGPDPGLHRVPMSRDIFFKRRTMIYSSERPTTHMEFKLGEFFKRLLNLEDDTNHILLSLFSA